MSMIIIILSSVPLLLLLHLLLLDENAKVNGLVACSMTSNTMVGSTSRFWNCLLLAKTRTTRTSNTPGPRSWIERSKKSYCQKPSLIRVQEKSGILEGEIPTTMKTETPNGIQITHTHYTVVDSTHNKCQELLQQQHQSAMNSDGTKQTNVLVVTATDQTNGRGTNKRLWTSLQGNTFLTIAFPMDILTSSIQSCTLLPLKIGNIIASCAQLFLKKSNATVSLKWPNDVLVNDLKLAGVLIETFSSNNDYYFLVGIGVNVAHAPTTFSDGLIARPATCLANYTEIKMSEDAIAMATSITNELVDWLDHLLLISNTRNATAADDERNNIITTWEQWAQPWMGKKTEIRDKSSKQYYVVPIGIQSDGQLKVKFVSNTDGSSQIDVLPMTDYLL